MKNNNYVPPNPDDLTKEEMVSEIEKMMKALPNEAFPEFVTGLKELVEQDGTNPDFAALLKNIEEDISK